MQQRSIEEVLEAHTPRLMAIAGVIGTGIGLWDGRSCIKVFVSQRAEDLAETVGREIEGYGVVIEETGEIRPLQ